MKYAAHMEEMTCIKNIGWNTWREKTTQKTLAQIGEGIDWMHLAQNRDHWWDVMDMVMNLQVP
jgi:hypothetical protein